VIRVAALLPAATDMVIALGAGEHLVAVTHACTLPARLAGVPRVTRSRVAIAGSSEIDAQVSDLSAAGAPLFELDEVLLAAQRPDVILTQAVCEVCAVREEDARAVAARLTPVPHVATLGATTVNGILDDITTVARALDVPEEAEELVAGLRSRMESIHRKLKAAKTRRPCVLAVEWIEPVFSAGHWVPDMIRRAGGHEMIGQSGQVSRRVGIDELRAAKPDLVLVAPCGYGLAETIQQTTAQVGEDTWPWSRSTPVWVVDANRLTSSPGPGVVHGIEAFAAILHPELFGDPSPRDAVRVTSP
jgi:iron complex transport system substrate-binding protein